jgi:hypothetical protein
MTSFCLSTWKLWSGCYGCQRRCHAVTDEILDLRPEAGIALALHMAGGESALEPRCSGARHGSLLVVEAVVAENPGFGIIGGGDLGAAVDQAMRLIKIHRGGDVVGDDLVVLPGLGDAVDLHGEQHGDSNTIQFAREHHYGGRSPTVAEQNDARLGFFLGAQNAVMIHVEPAKDGFVSGSSVTVLEDLDGRVFRQVGLNSVGQLHGAVIEIVVAHEAAGEADEDVRRCGWGMGGDGSVCGMEPGRGRGHDCDQGRG